MGASIYYTAIRPTPLTEVERAEVGRIVSQRNAFFPFDFETLVLSPPDPDRPDVVLDGSTKITFDLGETAESLEYWCDAVSELRRVIPGATWFVHLDEVEIPWDEKRGYRLPGLDDPGFRDAVNGLL